MGKGQYNNIIFNTLKRESSPDGESLKAVRKICNNLGVALPQGNCSDIYNTLKAGGYMAWKKCSAEEARAAANSDIAAIAITENSIAIIPSDDIEMFTDVSNGAAHNAVAVDDLNMAADVAYYSYGTGVLTTEKPKEEFPFVDIPQDGDIGTFISFMGYHASFFTASAQYALRTHSRESGRYSISFPRYGALIDGRMVIATKEVIGGILKIAIGDYVDVKFKTDTGKIYNFECIIGDIKGSDATNPWGHNDGRCVVEIVYHDYNPPTELGYLTNSNDPWGKGRILRITRVGSYGKFK